MRVECAGCAYPLAIDEFLWNYDVQRVNNAGNGHIFLTWNKRTWSFKEHELFKLKKAIDAIVSLENL